MMDRTSATVQAPTTALHLAGTLEPVPFDRKLLADAGSVPERFGTELAARGDVLVVTVPNATVDGQVLVGAADVFLRDGVGGVWVRHKRLTAPGGVPFDQLGATSVAIGDDDAIFLGASRAKVGNTLQQGAVHVFERHAGGTDNWGHTLTLTDDTVGSIGRFGVSIAVQGGLLAVGANRGGGGNGQVTLFERDPGGWVRAAAVLDSAAGDGGNAPESFGSAVALDGDLLLVGAESADVSYFGEEDGAAYLFRRDETDRSRWSFVTRLTDPEATLCPGGRTLAAIAQETVEVRQAVERCARDQGRTDRNAFGGNVAIAGDTIVVSAALARTQSGQAVGAVHVFRRDPTGPDRWEPIAKLAGSDAATSAFGGSIALSGDTLLVGAGATDVGGNADQGAVYRFERHAAGPDAWGETAMLIAADGLSGENFGSSVALDGTDAIVGVPGHDVRRGAVYVTGAQPAPPGPAFPATGELVDGGVLEGPGGVLLGAAAGSLGSAVPVWVHEVPAPDEPLSTFATALGPYYNVGALTTTTAPASAPFALALPVPAGADPAHLGVALLIPAGDELDASGAGPVWAPIRGVHDAENGLLSVVLPALLLQGQTVVLMQHPDLTPIVPAPASMLLRADEADVLAFDLTCYDFPSPEFCGPEDIQNFKDYLRDAYDRFVAQGFTDPALRSKAVQIRSLGSDPAKQVVVAELTFYTENYIMPATSTEMNTGKYTHYGKFIGFKFAKGFRDSDMPPVAAHELFHAFQFGGPSFGTQDTLVYTDYNEGSPDEVNWIVEGTAAAAEDSDQVMRRSVRLRRGLHPVHKSLLAGDKTRGPEERVGIAYQAQDFWVYFGNKTGGLGLGYLKELFERGANVDAAVRFFAEEHATTLAAEYWSWVKNQAIEKTVDLDRALPDPCRVEIPRDAPVIGDDLPVLHYPGVEGGPATLEGTLSTMTAAVVRVEVHSTVGRTLVTAGQPAGGLAYKVYVNGESGCGDRADNERLFESLTPEDTLYVVLANTDHEAGSRIKYTLEVKRP
jgi:hypothetical protein